MDFVLNRPVATVDGEQLLWTGLVCCQAGDAVDEFRPGVFSAQIGGEALQAEDLGDIGEVEVSDEIGAGADGAGLNAPMALCGLRVLRGEKPGDPVP